MYIVARCGKALARRSGNKIAARHGSIRMLSSEMAYQYEKSGEKAM